MKARTLLAALALGCAGCAGCAGAAPPPDTVSIDSGFTAEQAAVLRDGIAAWCDAVGWCPAEVAYSDRGRYILTRDYARDTADDTSCAYNDHENLFVDADCPFLDRPDVFWGVAAHETGHWGIYGHPVEKPALMAAELHTKDKPREIDAESRDAWCDQSGCPR